jgi:ribosomal protein L37AE/L43A
MKLDNIKARVTGGPQFFLPCAQCGNALLAPDWSEHVNERCVRHVWSCDVCGYDFETSVYLSARAA